MGVLDPVTRRRVAALLLVAGIVVAVLALRDVGPFSDPPTEAERAAQTVADFFGAAAEGDFKTFCRLLTDEARQGIETRAAAIAAQEGLSDCEEILAALAKRQLAGSEATIMEVSVSGPQARVEVSLRLHGESGREQRTVLLQELRDRWRISDPGFG